MSDLTREYLDKKLDGQTKEIKSYVDDRISSVEENLDIKIETEVGRLETKIEIEIAELARITKNGFDEVKKELDVRRQVENHNRRIFQIEQALNIKN